MLTVSSYANPKKSGSPPKTCGDLRFATKRCDFRADSGLKVAVYRYNKEETRNLIQSIVDSGWSLVIGRSYFDVVIFPLRAREKRVILVAWHIGEIINRRKPTLSKQTPSGRRQSSESTSQR